MKSLLVIGAGGHGQVVAECAEACGYENIDFLDDNNPDAVGGIDQLEEVVDKYNGVIVSIGKNDTRRELIRRVQNINAPQISLIHPTTDQLDPSESICITDSDRWFREHCSSRRCHPHECKHRYRLHCFHWRTN